MSNEPVAELFASSGELSALLRGMDWTRTPLGPVSQWPRLLRASVGICLSQRFPTLVLWGTEFVLIYNQGYSSILESKHPWAIGRPFREVWPEVWDVLGPQLQEVVSTKRAPAAVGEQPPRLLAHRGGTRRCALPAHPARHPHGETTS